MAAGSTHIGTISAALRLGRRIKLRVLEATRERVELYRHHMEQRKLAASTFDRRLSTVCGLYRFAHMPLDVVTDSCSTVTMPDLEEVEAMVQRHLAVESTMFLSTSAEDQPWVAGVFFTERGSFELSIILEVGGRTLSNIRRNPSVAVVVSHGDPFAPFLQGAATAEVLDDDGARPVVAALRSKSPQIEPLLGAPFVAVTLRVAKWRATDVVNGWLPGVEITAESQRRGASNATMSVPSTTEKPASAGGMASRSG